MGFSIDLLNNIRLNNSPDYQARIPVATQTNLSQIGYALQTYTPLYNEFSTALLCKIGKTMIESKLFKNRLARFKTGTILSQQDVEEIFVEMAKAEGAYDPQGTNPLGRRKTVQDKVVYHRMNRQDKYVVSIGDLDFVRVFRSEATLDAYITKKINALYSGANKDEFLVMVNLLAEYGKGTSVAEVKVGDIANGTEFFYVYEDKSETSSLSFEVGAVITEEQFEVLVPPGVPAYHLVPNYFEYEVPVIAGDNAQESAKTFVKTLRKAVMDCTLDSSTEFNSAHVDTWAEKENLVLLVHKDVVAEVDVEVLAKAFNMGKTDIEVTIVPMPHFGSMTDCYGLLLDKDFFRVWDTLSHMERQRNADGLFTNYFYHVHQIVSCSPFKTAIKLKKAGA